MSRRLKVAVLSGLAALTLVLAIAAPSSAGIGSVVLSDCNAHDALTKSYTAAELRDAIATMPATMREYTDCQDVISRALNTALGTGGSTGGKNNGAGSSSSPGGSSLSTGVIVIIVVLALVASTLGAIAIRRRRAP